MTSMQRNYWNRLSAEYHTITRISLTDFHYGPQIPGERTLKILPPLKRGQRALELGCGGAQNSVILAKRGLRCAAVDISAAQLAYAASLADQHRVAIDFTVSPLETFHTKFHAPFDFIHSSHAFEFVKHPAAILRRVARLLRPGGHLMLSTVHPLYQSEWAELTDGDGKGVSGLFLPTYFAPPDDIRRDATGRIEVISRAYPVSFWTEALRAAGLTLIRLLEPPAVTTKQRPPYTSDDWANDPDHLRAVPTTLILLAKREKKHPIP